MKQVYLLLMGILIPILLTAQSVGINTNTPDASSILDISANDKGVLFPRVSLSNVSDNASPINSPTTGLLIYNTNASVTGGDGVGYYYYDGSNWVKLTTDAGDSDWTVDGNDIYNANSGNVGIGNSNPIHMLDLGQDLGQKLAVYQHETNGDDFYGFGISPATLEIYADADNSSAEPQIVLKNTGRVGIGTTAPSVLFEVEDDATGNGTSAHFLKPNIDANTGKFAIGYGREVTDGQAAYLHYYPNSTLSDARSSFSHHGNDDILNIMGSGNVGIGTNAPAEKFEVFVDNAGTTSADRNITGGFPKSGAGFAWQSFTATNTGTINYVRLAANTASTGGARFMYLYEGEGNGGTTLGSGFASISGTNMQLNLTGVTVTAGQQYTIGINNSSGVYYSTTDPYSGGQSSIAANEDFYFITSVTTSDQSFSVGGNGVSINDYTFPLNDGAADEIMVSNGAGSLSWKDATSFDTDDQTLSLSGTDLTITDGNTVDLSGIDTDTDDQTLSLSGNDLTISDGNTVDLSSLAFNDGDWTVDGNDIYSANSGNVGIGTNTPGSKLEVEMGVHEIVDQQNLFSLYSYTGSTSRWQSFTAGVTGELVRVYLQFAYSGTRYVRIYEGEGTGGTLLFTSNNSSSGTFTIGGLNLTAGEKYTIWVNSSHGLRFGGNYYSRGIASTGTGIDLKFTTYMIADYGSFQAGDNGVLINDYALPGFDGAAGSVMTTDGDGKAQWEDPSTILNGIWTVSGNDIYNANTGFVGIGTTSPEGLLTLHGTNADTNPILHLRSGNDANTTNDGAQIAFGWNGSSDYQHFIHTRHNGANSAGNAIDFYVCDATQNNSVTSGSVHNLSLVSGSVGVGTTAPGQRLEVYPNTDQSGIIGRAYIGYVGHPDYAAFSHMDQVSTGSYALLQYHTGETFVNAASGQNLNFRINNATYMQMHPNGRVSVVANSANPTLFTNAIFGVRRDVSSAGNDDSFVASIENWEDDNNDFCNGLTIVAGSTTPSVNHRMITFGKPTSGGSAAVIGSIRQNSNTSVSYATTSDERLKTNFEPSSYGLDELMQVEVQNYNFKEDLEFTDNGFVAQQLHQVYPFAVSEGGEELDDIWMVDYGRITPLLVKAIQDQQQLIEELQERLAELEGK